MNLHRIRQVAKYGWLHAGQISQEAFDGKKRMSLFFDIFGCYIKYGMWSNQYMKERFWEFSKDLRETVGRRYCEVNQKREEWVKDFYDNRKFYIKYGNIKYEKESLRVKRNDAYTKRYNAGDNLFVENDVIISRQHYLDGQITIGNNVLLAKHVFIDYSGEVIIKDNVQVTNGVIIETHHHAFHSNPSVSRDTVLQTSLVIEDGAVLGSRAIILSSCHYIGRNARVGAGAVVTKDVPDNAVAVGVPAKVVKYIG